MNRIAAVAAAIVGASVLPLPGAQAAAAPRMQVWEVVRTSWAPSQLALAMDAGYSESRTILGVTYLRHERSGIKVLPGAHLSSTEGTGAPQAYGGGHRVSCPSGVDCLPTKGMSLKTVYYNDNGRNDPVAPDTVLVVTYGIGSRVSVTSGAKQWRVRKVSRAARAAWSSDSKDAAGVWHSAAGVEAFTTASLKGGSRGSVAIGIPPCGGTPVALGAGAGTATLSGGVAPVETVCPRDVLRPSQVARKGTTWTFSGTVAGATAHLVSEPGTVRLVVIDL